ncbi:GNAT family N-acetyltransferase [Robertmurraya kyonggiensis]|uniref:GNAT family N-acetyltransferase n=1 Tax=Robertmurraya kyonggiensis TaxID=1037680 RepID=A0A4U1DA91_9BACI|nr:GNAT family protein [Robertmurraya kyonggiensis]TKC18943.1 GNAT family N-acetyltransferase [Robertmurraya kyonggiensis]
MIIDTDVTLDGSLLCLIPFDMKEKYLLIDAIKSLEVWKYTWREVKTIDDIEEIMEIAAKNKKERSQIPFMIKEKLNGQIIGTTRIGEIDAQNRNVEIGWTWLSPAYWRTGVNTECKYLLLQYCFEVLKLIRVQFSVSGHNVRSQKAVERIGAIKEGTFRKHRIKSDGTVHDNVFYGILDSEWKEVKENLLHLMGKEY